MKKEQFSRQKNGVLGEERTESILLEEFWVLRRSIDIAGADLLVQIPAYSIEDLNSTKDEVKTFGIVQAKYMQAGTTVKIAKDYVEVNSVPRDNFFVFIQRNSRECKYDFHYFTTEEIIGQWYVSKCQKYYCFGEVQAKIARQFKLDDRWDVLEDMRARMQRTAAQDNIKLIERLFGVYVRPTQHHSSRPNFEYSLRRVDGVPIVICNNLSTGAKHLLEHRRELYQDQGSFGWGGNGTGAHALSASMLAHHFNGERPAEQHVHALVYNLIASKSLHSDHLITSNDILTALDKGLTSESYLQQRTEAFIPGAKSLGVEMFTITSMIGDSVVNITLKTGEAMTLNLSDLGIGAALLRRFLDICNSSTDVVKPTVRVPATINRSSEGEILNISVAGAIYFDN